MRALHHAQNTGHRLAFLASSNFGTAPAHIRRLSTQKAAARFASRAFETAGTAPAHVARLWTGAMPGKRSSSSDAPAVPRLAASLILIGPVPRSDSYRVLLVRRTIKAKGAFNDAYVFPGGVVDEADRSTAWDGVAAAGTDDERRLRALKVRPTFSASLIMQVCALRETFEETGVLVETRPGEALPNRRALRNQVHDKPHSFVELVKKRKHSVGLDRLVHWSWCARAPIREADRSAGSRPR